MVDAEAGLHGHILHETSTILIWLQLGMPFGRALSSMLSGQR